jgi:hypothetical protein
MQQNCAAYPGRGELNTPDARPGKGERNSETDCDERHRDMLQESAAVTVLRGPAYPVAEF